MRKYADICYNKRRKKRMMNMEILFGILLGAFLILCIAFFLFRQSPKETLRVKEVLKMCIRDRS